VSRYDADGITKTVARESDADAWAAVKAAGREEGPLSFSREGGAFTLIEYYAPKPRLIILGGGHIALPLSTMGALLDFQVVVFDDRPVFANAARFPEAHTVICDSFATVMERLRIRETDYVVIVTRGHQHDTLCLRGVLRGEIPYYIGMIGSGRRVAIVRRQLLEEGFPAEEIARVHAPIGLPIGAVTPQEIAISILSEVVREKRKGAGASDAQALVSFDTDLVDWLANAEHEADALVTVVSTQGSTPREAGARMAVSYAGGMAGSIGGGCAEANVVRDARIVIRNGGYSLNVVDLTDSAEEDGMVCGGTMTILTESLRGGAAFSP
jgi:xanthine dehydrogenase accessory factor